LRPQQPAEQWNGTVCSYNIGGHLIMMCFPSILPMQFAKFQRFLKRLAIFKNISCVGEGIRSACRAVHMTQFVSLIIDAMTGLLVLVGNETCLKEIPVERYLQ
jgi:hypothetical protein